MYRIGCCIPGASFMPQTGGEKAYAYDALTKGYKYIMDTGFDYAEATVGTLTELSPDELEKAVRSGMKIEVCNSFVPPALAFFETTDDKLREYVGDAMMRMAKLGTEYVILGSGQARNVPDDVEESRRLSRLTAFLEICSELYEKYGIKTALEPLNYKETNCINKVSEGYDYIKKLNLPGVFLLADAYHMYVENEPLSVLSDCEDLIKHVHISEPDRKAPGKGEGTYLKSFSESLKKTSYTGRVSVECVFTPGGFYDECIISYGKTKELFGKGDKK